MSYRGSNSANGSAIDPGKSLAAARYRPASKWRVLRRAWRHMFVRDKAGMAIAGVCFSACVGLFLATHYALAVVPIYFAFRVLEEFSDDFLAFLRWRQRYHAFRDVGAKEIKS